MVNTFLTPDQVAATALALLRADLVLGAIVNRQSETDFAGKVGATVNVRVPATLTARTRALGESAAITVDDLAERSLPVTLTEHAYSAVRLSDEDLTLDIQNFARQVLAPQVSAISRHVEQAVANVMLALPETTGIAYDPANPLAALRAARKVLRTMGVPAGEMFAVVGVDVAEHMTADEKLTDVAASGSDSALRDSVIGRVHGFQVVEHNLLPAGAIVAFHRDAFTLATVAPVVPEGATSGHAVEDGGYAMRALRDYDPSTLADRSVVSTFLGARSNDLTKVDGTTAVPAIRIDTTTPAA